MTLYIGIVVLILFLLIIIGYITPYFIRRRNMKLLCSVTSPDRGTESERRLVVQMLKKGVHPKAIFHDLYLKKQNGEYSQIDIVVATPQGLIVIEVKDYSGKLYGSGYQRYWTKLIHHGREKYHFYNPIMQNASHIRALREQSKQFAYLPIFNIVLFDGDCILKDINDIPDETYVGYTSSIKRLLKFIDKLEEAHYTDKKEVARILHQAVNNGKDPEIVEKHIAAVNDLVNRMRYSRNWLYRFFRFLWKLLTGN